MVQDYQVVQVDRHVPCFLECLAFLVNQVFQGCLVVQALPLDPVLPDHQQDQYLPVFIRTVVLTRERLEMIKLMCI